jgi:hypothetical protein
MLKHSKSGRFLGFVRDPTGRPVETAPFARRREAQEDLAGRTPSAPQPARPVAEGDRWKAAIALGVQMAESEARYMLAMKARRVSTDDKAVERLIAKWENGGAAGTIASPRKKPE